MYVFWNMREQTLQSLNFISRNIRLAAEVWDHNVSCHVSEKYRGIECIIYVHQILLSSGVCSGHWAHWAGFKGKSNEY